MKDHKLSWAIAMQLGVWFVSIMLAYGAINTRLKVLEVRYDLISQDIHEIKADIKQLLGLARGVPKN